MRAFAAIVVTLWAIRVVSRLPKVRELVMSYLVCQLGFSIAGESALAGMSTSDPRYSAIYTVAAFPALACALAIGFSFSLAVAEPKRWVLQGVALLVAGIAFAVTWTWTEHVYWQGVPWELAHAVSKGTLMLLACLLVAFGLPGAKDMALRRAGGILAALWGSLAAWNLTFGWGIVRHRATWEGLNLWVPTMLCVAAFGWLGFVLRKERVA